MTDTRNRMTDDEVSREYRELADNRVPEHLDQKVLETAARAVQSNGGWRNTWYRPLTVAATVGLAFAFVLQLGDLSLSVGPPGQTGAPDAPAPDVFEDAGRENAARFRELQVESERTMQPAPNMRQPSADIMLIPSLSIDGNQQPTTPQCTDEERQTAATWWSCIRELEKSGLSQAAEVELQALLRAFPSFERPE